MFKKSSFNLVFNCFLALTITLIATIFKLAVSHELTPLNLAAEFISGFALTLTVETMIDLPAFGNFFVQRFHLKMESFAAYVVRVFFIVLLLVIIMSFLLMFCQLAPTMGAAWLAQWAKTVPIIFVLAYIVALIMVAPCMKASMALCTKE